MSFRRASRRAVSSPPTADQIRLKVLDLASEGATALFMLPGFGLEGDGHQTSPRLETKLITRELVEAGSIVVYAIRVGHEELLDTATALAAVDADANWEFPGREGAEALYEVTLTDEGDALYWNLRGALGASSGPHFGADSVR